MTQPIEKSTPVLCTRSQTLPNPHTSKVDTLEDFELPVSHSVSLTRPRTLSATFGAAKTPAAPKPKPITDRHPRVLQMRQNQSTQVFTAGRPPCFAGAGVPTKPLVIGVAGGTASGKTTVCEKIVKDLNLQWVVLLSMDSFYKNLSGAAHDITDSYNFDHPDAFDVPALVSVLERLKMGQSVVVPRYDFTTHSRCEHGDTMYGADVILLEGILVFYWPEIRQMIDIKIFVDTDSDVRLSRRILRDIRERGRTVDGVIRQYLATVKPSFDEFCSPTMKFADVIVPRGADNVVAINLLVTLISQKMKDRRTEFHLPDEVHRKNVPLPPNFHVMPQTTQTRGIHTIMRNRETRREKFIFFAERLTRLLLEWALDFLPFQEKTVITPTGGTYQGLELDCRLCGVSIMRAGEALEAPLSAILKTVATGKILIQTDPVHKIPHLFYLKLPKDISNMHVFLLEPMIATGKTAMMAVRVLLDHGVREDRITFCSLLAVRTGVLALAYAFPRMRILTTELDSHLNDNSYIIPGIGNFGNRYFGTEEQMMLDDSYNSTSCHSPVSRGLSAEFLANSLPSSPELKSRSRFHTTG